MFLMSEVRLCTSWLSIVSRLMEGLKGMSSTTGNAGGAATVFTSATVGTFGSGLLSVTASGTGTETGCGSASGFGSGTGCALSGENRQADGKSVTLMPEFKHAFRGRRLQNGCFEIPSFVEFTQVGSSVGWAWSGREPALSGLPGLQSMSS